MATVVRWLDSGPEACDAEVAGLLAQSDCEEAVFAWGASQNREERQRSRHGAPAGSAFPRDKDDPTREQRREIDPFAGDRAPNRR